MVKLTEYRQMSKIKGLNKIYYASTPETQALGLMDVKHLPEDHGMLFIFNPPKRPSFWIKNTFIPLDIAFIDSNGIIKEIHQLYPLDEVHVIGQDEYKYALLVNRGWFKNNNYSIGDKII